MDKMNCNPILVRLAWHDAGTYDKSKTAFGCSDALELMSFCSDAHTHMERKVQLSLAKRYIANSDGWPLVRLHFTHIGQAGPLKRLTRPRLVVRGPWFVGAYRWRRVSLSQESVVGRMAQSALAQRSPWGPTTAWTRG